MTKIVAMIKVEDLDEWERGFLRHGDLFRSQTINGQYDYTMIEADNRVVLCADVRDVDTFFKALETPAADAAKDLDGVFRESIHFFVLEKQFKF
jgi:hypothetical protein